ncbi:MAG: phosphatase PAP2 family protein [Maribacter sp.]|nr:phosphatase PAP2 family protein [Maribacter sp.]
MLDTLLRWDRNTFLYLYSLGSEKYDGFWNGLSNFYISIPLFLALITLLFWKNPKKKAQWMIITYVGMIITVTSAMLLTKAWIVRVRPINAMTLGRVIDLPAIPVNHSFFSGHTATSFAIAVLSVLFLGKKIKATYLIIIWAILLSYSRIYLGVHYPLDVIAGAVMGILFAWLFYGLYKRFKEPYLG